MDGVYYLRLYKMDQNMKGYKIMLNQRKKLNMI
jgi:hypothetical protein